MLKSNKGITLTSLAIYIIGLLMIVVIMTNLSGYFNKNMNDILLNNDSKEEYAKFLDYIKKDIDSNNATFYTNENTENNGVKINYVVFGLANGIEHHYLIKSSSDENDGGLYFIECDANGNISKKILLCSSVQIDDSDGFKLNESNLEYSFKINNESFSGKFAIKI